MKIGEVWKCKNGWCAMGMKVKITYIFDYNVEFTDVNDDERCLFPKETFLRDYEKVYE